MLFSYAKFDFNVPTNALNIFWHCDGGFMGGVVFFWVVFYALLGSCFDCLASKTISAICLRME